MDSEHGGRPARKRRQALRWKFSQRFEVLKVINIFEKFISIFSKNSKPFFTLHCQPVSSIFQVALDMKYFFCRAESLKKVWFIFFFRHEHPCLLFSKLSCKIVRIFGSTYSAAIVSGTWAWSWTALFTSSFTSSFTALPMSSCTLSTSCTSFSASISSLSDPL